MSERESPSSSQSVLSSVERRRVVHRAVEMFGRLRDQARERVEAFTDEQEVQEIRSEIKKRSDDKVNDDWQEKCKALYEQRPFSPLVSEVTRAYFADWDDVRIEGNPELKTHLRVALLEAEARNVEIYRQKADSLGFSVEEYKSLLQAKAEEMVLSSQFYTAVDPEILSRILRIDGRWKTQFETLRSGGKMSPNRRAESELLMFGFNMTELDEVPSSIDAVPRKNLPTGVLAARSAYRPVYGYLSDHPHGYVSRSGSVSSYCVMRSYGKVHVRLRKESMLPRTTVTFHDSLSPSADWPPSPASKPHFASIDLRKVKAVFYRPEFRSGKNDWGEDYLEAQYHGQLRAQDIESVHISSLAYVNADEMAIVKRIVGGYNDAHTDHHIRLEEYSE